MAEHADVPLPPPDRCTQVFSLVSDPDQMSATIRQIMASDTLCDLSPGDRANAELLLAEVMNNIGEHAYAGGAGPIRLRLDRAAHLLTLQFEDAGRAMPGGDLPAGHLPEASNLPEGGFGWFLIRALASDLSYQRAAGHNHLTLRLRLEQCGC